MIYLSKGILQKNSTEQLLYILHGGRNYELTGMESVIWLNGRFGFFKTQNQKEANAIAHLRFSGLVESEPDDGNVSKYRIATRCIFCPANTKRRSILSVNDSTILYWLKHAGIRLSVAELICLFEYG